MSEERKDYGTSDHPMTRAEHEAAPKAEAGTAEPKAIPGLIEGRMVHYVIPDGSSAGQHRPAIIVRAWNHEVGLVNLHVFYDGTNDGPAQGRVWETSVLYSEEPKPRTWHWIERA